MVSKLMLAAQETVFHALESGADEAIVESLKATYFEVQSGLGYRRSPQQFGAFPAEPYSHSPGHAGAQQPGLTGQVKEGILCRMGELGVDFTDGKLRFHPQLLRAAEFDGLQSGLEHPPLPKGTIQFTLARTPVSYHLQNDLETPSAEIHFNDGTSKKAPYGILDVETTAEITRQTGSIKKIEVSIPGCCLVS
jgi:hypothetical protein